MFQPTFGHNFRQKRYENELNCSLYCRNIFSIYIYESPKYMHGTLSVPQWIMQNLRQCWQIGTFAMRFEWNQKNPKWLWGFYGRSNKNLVFHLEFVWNGMKERPCYVQHLVDHGPWWFGSWVKRIIPADRHNEWKYPHMNMNVFHDSWYGAASGRQCMSLAVKIYAHLISMAVRTWPIKRYSIYFMEINILWSSFKFIFGVQSTWKKTAIQNTIALAFAQFAF